MFTITSSSLPNGTLLICNGRLDNNGGPILDEALAPFLSERNAAIVLDFSAVNYLSSAGVRSLLVALKKTKMSGGSLTVRNGIPDVAQVLKLSGLSPLLEDAPSGEVPRK